MSRPRSPQMTAAVTWFVEHGGTMLGVADAFGVSVAGLQYALRSRGYRHLIRGPGSPKAIGPTWSRSDQAAREYLAGQGTLEVVGAKYGLTRQAVSLAVKRIRRLQANL